MKLTHILASSLVIAAAMTATAFANETVKLTINGASVGSEVPPQIINGHTMVPVRTIFEGVGARVSWDADTKTITGKKGSTIVTMQVDSNIVTVDGESKTIEAAPVIIDGRTLAPVRYVAEAFGGRVDWNPDTKVANIRTYKNKEAVTEATTESPKLSVEVKKRVVNAVSAEIGNYSVGKAESAAKLKKEFFDSTVKPNWDKAVQNDVDVNYINAMGTLYITYSDAAKTIDFYYRTEPYSSLSTTSYSCKEVKEKIVAIMKQAIDTEDISLLEEYNEQINQIIQDFKNEMK